MTAYLMCCMALLANGDLARVLDGFNIPYTGCGVLASTIAMDKFRNRLVWQALDLPNVPYVVLDDNTDFTAIEQQLGLPLFVKPAAEGSSVGVFKIKEAGELARPTHSSNNTTALFWQKKAITGVSMLCSILGDEVLPSIRIIPTTEFYDYEAKYNRDDTVYQCPSDLSEAQEQTMQQIARKAFAAIGAKVGHAWIFTR